MAIKWDKMTVKSQEAVQAAATMATEHGNPEVMPLHLLAALLEDREGIVLPVLEKSGVPAQQLLFDRERGHRKTAKNPGCAAAAQRGRGAEPRAGTGLQRS